MRMSSQPQFYEAQEPSSQVCSDSSLEQKRAILDCGRQMLTFPGQGDIQMVLLPGSLEVPLQKAPSGHLAMVIDDYEQVVQRAGGLPAPKTQLHSAVGELPSQASGSEEPPRSAL